MSPTDKDKQPPRPLQQQLATLHPAYFALVMATGIVAIACHLFAVPILAQILTGINLVAYPTLWVLYGIRLVRYGDRFLNDWSDHGRAPGFFTVVAATGVLGSQLALIHGAMAAASVFWWLCLVLWAICTYAIFTLLTVRDTKPTLAEGINGGWLVAVVATQAVCVLGCTLQGQVLGSRDVALFLLISFWLAGGMLYLWIIGMIFQRYMFFRFSPLDLLPPYWINMGAVAISTLAGALLAGTVADSPLLAPLRPFILGLTLLFWATATWWIPMLVLLGIWRHGLKKVAITYDPLYWGLVFPLGMYCVCTFLLAQELRAFFLIPLSRLFLFIAIGAWLLTFLGVCRRLINGISTLFHSADP
ncbi:tellurite resistance/C4-dicarboxylate transporter family protein [Desulfofustis limnaeus]|nr:tellurite resistance/C4-dicarboxylate transporter family protein [Desulfofustis limnaeus]MDX9895112.1 tellurite resistance/C4-dicarboxylate transporter family protein [Desulfofustis sp.]